MACCGHQLAGIVEVGAKGTWKRTGENGRSSVLVEVLDVLLLFGITKAQGYGQPVIEYLHFRANCGLPVYRPGLRLEVVVDGVYACYRLGCEAAVAKLTVIAEVVHTQGVVDIVGGTHHLQFLGPLVVIGFGGGVEERATELIDVLPHLGRTLLYVVVLRG